MQVFMYLKRGSVMGAHNRGYAIPLRQGRRDNSAANRARGPRDQDRFLRHFSPWCDLVDKGVGC
jgi:hypothetical protein